MRAIKATVTPMPESVDSQLFGLRMSIFDAIERAQTTMVNRTDLSARARIDAIIRLDRGQKALLTQAAKLRRDIDYIECTPG